MARSEIGRTGARFGAPATRDAPAAEDAASGPASAGPPPEHALPGRSAPGDAASGGSAPEDDLVGVTGARFGGHSARRTRKSRKQRAAESSQRTAENTVRPAEQRPARDEPQDVPAPDARDDAGDTDTAPLPVTVDDPAPQATITPVRPYVLTGGRTRARRELRLETLSVRPTPAPAPAGTAEKAAVLDLCSRTRSVSEVAALAAVPLGVARVLIDDLAAEGRLTVHGDADDAPSLELLDRVLSGLRRL
ncbi:DUF742 domain-containing protein [Pseudonocardia sp. C8]|uniref:DUF742 domain-containing protein n=1 Tax=Pseudonocardia sp. C8 TaxID=2762759 RepID=UPI0016432E54|nr:DUF742 domain-containing protein [Pseudonocardia sp. C8]MBC3191963.1 DUF742 domain-containing protein [Pseudonocardia sp. C8]